MKWEEMGEGKGKRGWKVVCGGVKLGSGMGRRRENGELRLIVDWE